jgi:hypothetical protein
MFYTCMILSRWHAELFAVAMEAANDTWALLTPNVPWFSNSPHVRNTDLTTLGLERMPSSKGELHQAYRHAAKTAHPDAGGSVEAFQAVTEAFSRLAH